MCLFHIVLEGWQWPKAQAWMNMYYFPHKGESNRPTGHFAAIKRRATSLLLSSFCGCVQFQDENLTLHRSIMNDNQFCIYLHQCDHFTEPLGKQQCTWLRVMYHWSGGHIPWLTSSFRAKARTFKRVANYCLRPFKQFSSSSMGLRGSLAEGFLTSRRSALNEDASVFSCVTLVCLLLPSW